METTPSCLSRIFSRHIFSYCVIKGLKTELVYQTKGKVGFFVKGKGAAKAFKHESGKHTVQRCPPTENKGRAHTSVIMVSVLSLEVSSYQLRENDIDIKTQRGSGPGGQHQNTTDSAVRMTHRPTGISVFINGRSQNVNKKEARNILEQRVANHHDSLDKQKRDNDKMQQVDGGGRSNKIRTYNFVKGRVVDHRLGTRTSNVKKVMKGHFELLFNK